MAWYRGEIQRAVFHTYQVRYIRMPQAFYCQVSRVNTYLSLMYAHVRSTYVCMYVQMYYTHPMFIPFPPLLGARPGSVVPPPSPLAPAHSLTYRRSVFPFLAVSSAPNEMASTRQPIQSSTPSTCPAEPRSTASCTDRGLIRDVIRPIII